MTISERINKKFNSHGTTIEESIKNAQVGGGSAGYSVETTENTIVDLTGQKANWVYNQRANVSELGPLDAAIDDTIETLNVTLDGETKTFFHSTDPSDGAAWMYPETFETRPDMEIIMYDTSTPTLVLDVYTGDVSYDSVKITAEQETVTVEDDFKKAVEAAGGGSSSGLDLFVITLTADASAMPVTFHSDKTLDEIKQAAVDNKVLIVRQEFMFSPMVAINRDGTKATFTFVSGVDNGELDPTVVAAIYVLDSNGNIQTYFKTLSTMS